MKHTLQSLKVKPGESPSAAKWNGLLKEINQLTLLRSANLTLRQTPNGVMAMSRRGITPFKNWPFRIRDGETGITFDYGLIAGIEPEIGGVKISGEEDEDLLPEIPIEPKDLVYFELSFGPGWEITQIEVIVRKEPAVMVPWKAHKLAAVITEEGEVLPMVFFNLGHHASDRQLNGYARHWFYAM